MSDEERAKRIAAVRKKARQVAKNAAAPAIPASSIAPTPVADGSTLSPDAGDPGQQVSPNPDGSEPDAASSLAQQARLRSTSFRTVPTATAILPSGGPLGSDGETAADIYKKQAVKIEELDRENKKLKADLLDSGRRWKNAEEELAHFRKAEKDTRPVREEEDESTIKELQSKIIALERQNANLQRHISKEPSRRGSTPSASLNIESSELKAQLESKSSTVEAMELEISRLRSQVNRHSEVTASELERTSTLVEKLAASEAAIRTADREIVDLRRALNRTSVDSLRVGVEKTSSEVKIRTLEHDLAESATAKLELEQRVSSLDKKVATLTTLHREQDSRMHLLRREKDTATKDAREYRLRAELLEAELGTAFPESSLLGRPSVELSHHSGESVTQASGHGKAHMEKRIQDLESEIHDLRTGIWRDSRLELDGRGSERNPNTGFQVVDLSGAPASSSNNYSHNRVAGGFGGLLATGLNAFVGSLAMEEESDPILDDLDFDQEVSRKAREEEMTHRMGRMRELKRSLRNWQGWRMDIREARMGGGEGLGEIFEV